MKCVKLIAGSLAVLLSFGMYIVPIYDSPTITISAETSNGTKKDGWYTSNNNKIYYSEGKKVVSKTKLIGGKIYLFDENGYLVTNGMHTVNGNKYYSNKDGTVRCNQWVSHKYAKTGNTYYYAASTGKITEYKFKKDSDKTWCLYVNGKRSKAKDIPLNTVYNLSNYIDTSEYNELMQDVLNSDHELRSGYFKVGEHYYHLSYNDSKECVVCDYVDKAYIESYNCPKNMYYDLGSGKVLGRILGTIAYNNKGYIESGVFCNTKEKTVYIVLEDEVSKTKTSSPIILIDDNNELNSVGGLDYSLSVVNNSGKTINYIYYTVHVVNRVGDTVTDKISRDTVFRLKDTGPYAPNETSSGVWEAMMYNYSADKVIIDSIEVKYKDGTSKVVKGSDITSIILV